MRKGTITRRRGPSRPACKWADRKGGPAWHYLRFVRKFAFPAANDGGASRSEGLDPPGRSIRVAGAMHDISRGRIVVTGGAGLIGSALVWALNRRGLDDIFVVDRFDASEKWKHLVPLRFADYVEADEFAGALAARTKFGDVRTIFHLGACSSTTETDADYLLRNNYQYTKRLALWAVEHEARFVYASSAATYGGFEADLSDEADLHGLRPLNAYAYSKHLFDLYAQRTGSTKHLRPEILQCFRSERRS